MLYRATGILSELVLNATVNDLYRHDIVPEVEMNVGIVANDLNDLTPVALALRNMVNEACEEYERTRESRRLFDMSENTVVY